VTGAYPSPKARDWEYQNYRTTDPATTWYGHCDGWAAAAILDPEPTTNLLAGGVQFTVGDRKGILTSWHTEGGYATLWGTIYASSQDDVNDIYPYDFITVLIQHIVNQGMGVIADLTQTDEIWNYPIYGYDLTQLTSNSNGKAEFRCKIYFASDGVVPNFVGTKTGTKTLEFSCGVDTNGNFAPGDSSWLRTSGQDHPDFLWFPAPLSLVNPKRNQGLAKEHVLAIAGPTAPPAHQAHIEIRHTWIGDLTVKIGVGSPTSPQWSRLLWSRAGADADDIIMDVDLTEAAAYLPPGAGNVWYLEVNDADLGDTGTISQFTIRSGGVNISSPNTPVAIRDRQTCYAYVGATPPLARAQVGVQHTCVGDLVVQLGVGDPQKPTWSKTISNREGGGADALQLDVDVSDGSAYLPPGITNRWFVKVYDAALQDEGTITNFAIVQGTNRYASVSMLPVGIRDQQTSYAYVGPVSMAKVDIRHPYRGDLVVRLGVGSPASPLWVKTLSNREGRAFDDLITEVDLTEAAAYLPPAPSRPWFLEVTDAAAGDTGTVQAFVIKHQGQLLASDDVPLAVPDNATVRAYIGDNLFTSYAHVDIQHTWRGDLVVKVGVGNPASPLWVKTVSNQEGGSADNVIADVDLSEAAAYLPPGSQNPWFLQVADVSAGDTGAIRQFSVTHNGTNYASTDPPVAVADLQTAYAYIGRPVPTSVAHVDIQHTWRGDLVVKVGVGNPASPLWVKTISNLEGGSADDIVTDVDVSAAAGYLPPSPQYPWFLQVYDASKGDTGTIRQFSVTHNGTNYVSTDPPVAIKDKATCYANIGLLPPTSVAHVVIRHPWRGDLVVKVGVGSPSAPSWVTTVSDRSGGNADDVVADVDVSAAAAFLPPSAQRRWYLQAYDAEKRDTGTIESFVVTHLGTNYVSTSVPVAIPDLQTVYAYVP
jgi:subtilisin-like proprotein convertase family protein